MKFALKTLRSLAIGLLALYLVGWALTAYIHYPAPLDAIRLGLAEPSQTGKLMPSEQITAKQSQALTRADNANFNADITVTYKGASTDLTSVLKETKTNAFLIIHNGKIVREQYFNGFNQSSQLPSYSVAKSVVSILTGQLIADGQLSETDTFVGWLPQYKTGTAFDDITVANLIDMQSGVAVADNYPTGPSGWGAPIAQMYATTDLPNFIMNHRDLYWAPGTDAEYRSVDTQMMGMIIEKITGQSLPSLLTNGFNGRPGLWQAMHAEHNGTWNMDHVGGTAKAFCCLNISARDYAHLGLALLNGIEGKDNSVVSSDWAARMSGTVVHLDHKWGYGAFTWHPFAGLSMYLGLHGQIVLIDPASDTVMVKLADNKTDASVKATVDMMKGMLDSSNF